MASQPAAVTKERLQFFDKLGVRNPTRLRDFKQKKSPAKQGTWMKKMARRLASGELTTTERKEQNAKAEEIYREVR